MAPQRDRTKGAGARTMQPPQSASEHWQARRRPRPEALLPHNLRVPILWRQQPCANRAKSAEIGLREIPALADGRNPGRRDQDNSRPYGCCREERADLVNPAATRIIIVGEHHNITTLNEFLAALTNIARPAKRQGGRPVLPTVVHVLLTFGAINGVAVHRVRERID